MSPSQITAVLVTRGDVDLTLIRSSLWPFRDVLIYNNSLNLDYKVFSRYLAAQMARTDYVYVQDDDCIIDLPHYPWDQVSSSHILCNMPQGHRKNYMGRVQLVGFGAVFPKALIRPTFTEYNLHFGQNELLYMECDRYFTARNKCVLTDVEVTHLPWAESADRLYRQTDHWDRREQIERQIEFAIQCEGT
jgi:hypothetical protein